jgi:hypothetical protein
MVVPARYSARWSLVCTGTKNGLRQVSANPCPTMHWDGQNRHDGVTHHLPHVRRGLSQCKRGSAKVSAKIVQGLCKEHPLEPEKQ